VSLIVYCRWLKGGWKTVLATEAHGTAERRLAWSLAGRLLTHGENRFARFVTWVSFIGLTLGVMVLTVVITVMNGFDGELKSRLLRAVPHITIADATPQDASYDIARELDGVVSVHAYFQGLGAISVAGQVQPISLYGVSDSGLQALEYIAEHMVEGSVGHLRGHAAGMLLGAPLARYLGLQTGHDLLVLAVENRNESIAPKLMRFTLAGIFELGAEPDYSLAVVNLARQPRGVWQQLGDHGLQVQLEDPLQAPKIAGVLTARLPEADIDSWDSAYGELFAAVRMEKSMMFILLLLVVAIASFNIIAGQTMMVNDKRASIAILRTMGGKASLIRQVFLLQGVGIGVTGTLLGLALGLVCAFNINEILLLVQRITGMHLLDGSFFVEVPVLVQASDLLVIAALSCGLCLLSAWSPARRAAQLDPVQSLH